MSNPVIHSHEPLPEGVCVRLVGEVDLSRSPELRAGLLELVKTKPAKLIVDLTGVPYMDSSGIATLVETLQLQRRQQGRLVLFGLQPKLRSVFEVVRLNMVFTIVEDLDAARTA